MTYRYSTILMLIAYPLLIGTFFVHESAQLAVGLAGVFAALGAAITNACGD
jgi:hypothetical protein